MGKLKEFGFEWYLLSKKPKQHHLNAFEILVNADNKIDWNDKVNNGMKSRKQLTISDFKPTRTEYVKVTDSIFDLKADFEKGELYEKDSGYCKLISESDFAFAYRENAIYRKVEREITWQDELERLYPVNAINGHVSFKQLITDEQFIEMCHKVYHLTK